MSTFCKCQRLVVGKSSLTDVSDSLFPCDKHTQTRSCNANNNEKNLMWLALIIRLLIKIGLKYINQLSYMRGYL